MSYVTPLPADELSSDTDNLEARLAWRKSLTDTDVRGLAYDYKVGYRDQCSVDAWAEYEHRGLAPSSGIDGGRRKRSANQSRKRKAKGA